MPSGSGSPKQKNCELIGKNTAKLVKIAN